MTDAPTGTAPESHAAGAATARITRFEIAVPQAEITDLRERLTMTRWPEPANDGWQGGQPVAFIQRLAAYWRDRYDWRTHEATLNRYPQFVTEIDGQTIHFLHIRSAKPDATPLMLIHGWPSSFVEFLDVIGPLTDPRSHGRDPALAFDLVIPSLPGFGFSTPLSGPGWDAIRIANAFTTLMARLGYSRYGVQGGDAGALVAREMGILAPEGLIGVHLQQVFAFPDGTPGEMEKLTPFEQAGVANLEYFRKYAGYADIQSRRPGTLGYGLVDSPAAQLAWNAELFAGFEGEHAQGLDIERFLTHVALYWFTRSGASAAEFYRANAATGGGYRAEPNGTPTAVASFPGDFRSVRSFAERSNMIAHWTEMPRGGHFAASEQPDLLVDDIRDFFAILG